MYCLAWSLSRQVTISRGGPAVPSAVPICNVEKKAWNFSVHIFSSWCTWEDFYLCKMIRSKNGRNLFKYCVGRIRQGNSGVYVRVRHLKNRPLHYVAFARYKGAWGNVSVHLLKRGVCVSVSLLFIYFCTVAPISTTFDTMAENQLLEKSSIYCEVTPCGPLNVSRCFEGTYCLHLQGSSMFQIT
jgi:hypothetical protein